MKTCLENYIILKNGCYLDSSNLPIVTPVPTSGLYIENLEGLTLENIANITSEYLVSATNTVTEKLSFAAEIVEKRLKAVLNANGLKLNKIGTKYSVCSLTSNFAAPVAKNLGIRISKKWLSSTQSKIYVDSIQAKSATTGNAQIRVFDITQTLIYTQDIVLVADTVQSFSLKQHFDSDIIYVTISADTVSLYQYSCSTATNCKPCGDMYLEVTGWEDSGTAIGYLSACVRLDCTDKDILCQFLDRLGFAILYQTGVEILKEWTSPNNRINIIKTHGSEWAIKKLSEWESLSIEYLDNEIDNIIDILKQDKFCLNCENRIRMIPIFPA